MDKYKVVNAEQLDAELTNLANKIREKGGTTKELDFYEGDFTNAVGAISSGGGDTEELENLIDQSGVLESTDGTATEKINKVLKMAKWKNYIQQGLYFRPNIRHLIFADIDNPDILDLDFSRQTVLSDMFRSNPSLEEFIMDFSIVTEVSAFLAQASNLKKVVLTNTQGVKYWANAFAGCGKLVSIETLNLSSAISVSRTFADCSSLETIKIVPETIKVSIVISSPVLSNESIQSIIEGLATVETAQTLTLNATVKAKLTEEQLATITSKNWNLA